MLLVGWVGERKGILPVRSCFNTAYHQEGNWLTQVHVEMAIKTVCMCMWLIFSEVRVWWLFFGLTAHIQQRTLRKMKKQSINIIQNKYHSVSSYVQNRAICTLKYYFKHQCHVGCYTVCNRDKVAHKILTVTKHQENIRMLINGHK